MDAEQSLVCLRITNLRLHAYHGAISEERVLGGKYAIDLEVWYDASRAIETDALADAVNYEAIVELLTRSLNHHKFYLIEKVADYLLEQVLQQFPQIQQATIRVRKLSPPIQHMVDFIEVELHRRR